MTMSCSLASMVSAKSLDSGQSERRSGSGETPEPLDDTATEPSDISSRRDANGDTGVSGYEASQPPESHIPSPRTADDDQLGLIGEGIRNWIILALSCHTSAARAKFFFEPSRRSSDSGVIAHGGRTRQRGPWFRAYFGETMDIRRDAEAER